MRMTLELLGLVDQQRLENQAESVICMKGRAQGLQSNPLQNWETEQVVRVEIKGKSSKCVHLVTPPVVMEKRMRSLFCLVTKVAIARLPHQKFKNLENEIEREKMKKVPGTAILNN